MTSLSEPVLSALTVWLTGILGTFLKAAGVRSSRERALIPIVERLWHRVNRLRNRFARLLAKLATGWRPKLVAGPARARPANTDRVRPEALPRGHVWLYAMLPGDAASCASQLQAMLADPGMRAVLAEVPAAGRIMRPLCRLLGLTLGDPLGANFAPQPRRRAPAAPVPAAVALPNARPGLTPSHQIDLRFLRR